MPVSKDDVDRLLRTFPWDDYLEELHGAVRKGFEDIAVDAAEREAEALAIDFDKRDPFVTRFFTEYIGERVKQLDGRTRDTVTEELHSALEDGKGEGMTELAERLLDKVADSSALSPSRALMIARTETAIAYNTGSVMAFRQGGVEFVEVSDGGEDESGHELDCDCSDVDGEIWTLERALAEPVSHPNCVRAFAPADQPQEADGEVEADE
jgi:hypothetical protein